MTTIPKTIWTLEKGFSGTIPLTVDGTEFTVDTSHVTADATKIAIGSTTNWVIENVFDPSLMNINPL